LKKILPFIFTLSFITVILNVFLIVHFIIKNYTGEKDFIYLVLVMMFVSAQLIFLCRSIYNYTVTRGEKSINKIANVILGLCWIDLSFVSLSFIEGINAQQNPFTNNYVITSWVIISMVVLLVGFLERRYKNI
jgi:hypothetical protein